VDIPLFPLAGLEAFSAVKIHYCWEMSIISDARVSCYSVKGRAMPFATLLGVFFQPLFRTSLDAQF
jgi:hypothetical protein